jgi:hypothetical protein
MKPSYRHRGVATPLIGVPINAYFRNVAARHAEREAVVSVHQGIRWTCGEFGEGDAAR